MRDKIRKQIEKQIWFETEIDGELTPGFIIAVKDGESEMVLPFGIRQKGTEDTISIDDVFELGSVTKVFIAALFAELDRKNILSLEEEFDPFVPVGYRNPGFAGVSIADLLAHQSGLPRDPVAGSTLGNQIRQYPKYALEDLLQEYRGFQGPRRMVYSNLGYALLQAVLEGDHDALLEKHILAPNKMRNTGFSVPEIAPGYGVYDSITCQTDFGALDISGGLKSSMRDMLAFIRWCMKDSPEALWEDQGPGMNSYLRMALGWHSIEQKNGKVYLHTGRTLGHSSFVGICHATDTAVIILANSETGTDDLGMEVLRIMNNNWRRKE